MVGVEILLLFKLNKMREYIGWILFCWLLTANYYLYVKYHVILAKRVGKGGYWLKLYIKDLLRLIKEALLFPISLIRNRLEK